MDGATQPRFSDACHAGVVREPLVEGLTADRHSAGDHQRLLALCRVNGLPVRAISGKKDGKLPGKPRHLTTPAKLDRLLDELRKQHDEVLQALKKASLLVLAERDLRSREAEQIKADLSAVYEVLERNRRDQQQRLALLVR
jgi:hypothetical protein